MLQGRRMQDAGVTKSLDWNTNCVKNARKKELNFLLTFYKQLYLSVFFSPDLSFLKLFFSPTLDYQQGVMMEKMPAPL